MNIADRTFIGVSLVSGQKPYVFSALDMAKKPIASGRYTLDKLLFYIKQHLSANVAIGAPVSLNQGLMQDDEFRDMLSPKPKRGRKYDMRVSEYQLKQVKVNVGRTPFRGEDASLRIHQSIRLYKEILKLGFQAYPHDQPENLVMETNAKACFTVLLEQVPLSRITLEGRLQRQLVLFERGLEINNPMDFFEEVTRFRLLRGSLPLGKILPPDILDALMIAYTAHLVVNRPHKVTLVGDPGEGQIVLPEKPLNSKY
ncbi:MAG: DUF429 domain-containing protein [Anaerolineales bacterium]|nr:DUF429 domain-containing protein [Anaerolineales bacterium]